MLDWGVGVCGAMEDKFVSKVVDENGDGLDFSLSILPLKRMEICFYALSQDCGKLLLLALSCLSAWNSSAYPGRIFMKFSI